ncbi:MAG: hypothetical protein N2053_10500, partial [Chitinispirillaceae bacterium]|nr:hypothetical protein [Chitinispirillaceae bacterium]
MKIHNSFLARLVIIILIGYSFLNAQTINFQKSNYEKLNKEEISDSLESYSSQKLPYTEKELQLMKERYLKERKSLSGGGLSLRDTTDTSL